MKKYILSIFLFCLITSPAFAANTSGYAWSESLGWFDFSNTTINDTTVTGYAYNDNTGWIVLDGITNTDGTLSGYAWSESVGYFNFSDVYITDNTIKGYAYNDNTGWLSFEEGTNVTTTWAPAQPNKRSSTSLKTRINNLNKMGKTDKVLELQKQYNLPNTPNNTPTPSSNNTRDLELNSTGEDVKSLQQFLNSKGYIINTPGQPGSTGYETTYFGNLTRQALIKFQQANNITPALGYYGPKTKAFIKTLLITN